MALPITCQVPPAPLKGKLQFVVTVTDDLIEKKGLSAVELVRELERIAGGGGGGKRHLAQLGTKNLESEKEVLGSVPELIKRFV